jgi:hypothetical protein
MQAVKGWLGYWLSFRIYRYCLRCEMWEPTQDFYGQDEEGLEARHGVCSHCRTSLLRSVGSFSS